MAAGLTEQLVDTPLGKIQVLSGGTGAPLVYLHSATGETTNAALEDLAGDHAVSVPVFPGFGASEGIEHIDGIEDAAFHLLDVLDALDLRAPDVVGLSLGGWLAAELATRSPERVGRLVLVSPVGLHIEGAPVGQLFGRSPAELARELYADEDNPMVHMMDALSEMVGDVTKMAALPMDLLLPLWQSMSATAKIGWNPYLHNPKLAGRLRRVTAPTLVIAGAQDRFLPRAHPEAYAAGIRGACLEVVEGAGHMIPFERPAEFAALVRAFLSA
jgi:pimeloyl-ACP methyl ester carboxylesterase